MKIYILILLLIILSCCSTMHSEKYPVSLVKNGDLHLKLDSLTTNSIGNLQYFKNDSVAYVIFKNKGENNILFYKFKNNAQCEFRIYLAKDGPNGVGRADGFYVHNLDSIFVVSSYFSKIFLVNKEGEILKKYFLSMNKEDSTSTSMPYSSTHTPMVKVGDTLYIGAIPDVEPYLNKYNSKIKIALNIANGRYKYLHSYPEEYQQNYWGRTHMLFPNIYDEEKGVFIYSFPISDSLHIINQSTNKAISLNAKSLFLPRIDPMVNFTKDRKKLKSYLYKSAIYSSIIKDPLNQVYYRIAEQPTQEFNLNKVGKMKRPASIIVLNNNFEKIGETLIGNDYRVTHTFVAAGYFYILKEIQSDDYLSFGKYKLVNNK